MTCLMRCTRLVGPLALAGVSVVQAQDRSAPAIAQRLDTAQARVIVATLQPRTPAIAKNGHATNRVLIYLDDGVMTRKEGEQSTRIEFRRGDVRWRPASGAYIAENISDRPIRILEIDLKGPPAGKAPVTPLDPATVDPQHYRVEFENEQVRVLRVHYGAHEKGEPHEHILNRVVVYMNDQPGAKADDVRIAGAAKHAEENASGQPADRIAVERSFGRQASGLASIALALGGAKDSAEALNDRLAKAFPLDTLTNNVLLSCSRALIRLEGGQADASLDILRAAAPYELGWTSYYLPIYVRGLAYLRVRDGRRAQVEFHKIHDHRGIIPVSPLQTLAYLQLGRAAALQEDWPAARKSYEIFFAAWKDADRGQPLLDRARTEYEQLGKPRS